MSDLQNPSLPIAEDPQARRAFTMHDRIWQKNLFVYPVISRRSKGLSIGVNLNPDKACNFDCIYCSVDRKMPGPVKDVDIVALRTELAAMIDLARTGEIFRHDPFDKIPDALRRINDIAFSGDGEPTTYAEFFAACRIAAELKDSADLNDVKLVVITNATMFHRPPVQEALAFLDQHNGEIWAKLDAGTEAYYDLIDRTPVPFGRVLENIAWCAKIRPTVIQSLLMRVHDMPPALTEIAAYVDRLREIVAAGGALKLIQLYTVARSTTEAYATPLSLAELEAIAATVRAGMAGVPVEIYP